MRIAKINERERQRIAADIVSAQYHSPGLQRAKFDDLCKKVRAQIRTAILRRPGNENKPRKSTVKNMGLGGVQLHRAAPLRGYA